MTAKQLTRRLPAALLCGLFFLSAAPALAWNATGHRLVAGIAWEKMTPVARAEANRLLQNHPDYERWRKKAANDDSGRQVFIATATWPDEIRRDKRFYSPASEEPTPLLPGFPDMARHSDWHYLARPLDDAAATAPHRPAHLGQIDQALTTQSRRLGDRKAPLIERQYALPWLIHLVGDAHQPLHLSLCLDASGNWDKLGSGQMVSNPFNPRKSSTTLHTFWDDLAGAPGLRGEALDTAIRALLDRYPQAPRRSSTATWLDESWRLAREFGYPDGQSDTPITINDVFFERSRDIAERRVAEAGHRLGTLLNTLLGKQKTAQ